MSVYLKTSKSQILWKIPITKAQKRIAYVALFIKKKIVDTISYIKA